MRLRLLLMLFGAGAVMSAATGSAAATRGSSPPSAAAASNCDRRHLLRLCLVRHGTSAANRDGTLAGQNDSPLTDAGRREARALRRSPWLLTPGGGCGLWRTYSSDLSRARDTALEALAREPEPDPAKTSHGENTDRDWIFLRLDRRLRERAYGAREGLPRGLSMAEAEALRRQQQQQQQQQRADGALDGILVAPTPPYETEVEVTARCRAWLEELVRAALVESPTDGPRHVVAFSHAGFIRGLLEAFLAPTTLAEHPNYRASHGYEDGRPPKMLIANAGVSVLDVTVPIGDDTDEMDAGDDAATAFDVALVELNVTEHLRDGPDPGQGP